MSEIHGQETIYNNGNHIYGYDIDRLKYQRDIKLTNGFVSANSSSYTSSTTMDFKYSGNIENNIGEYAYIEGVSSRDDIEVILKSLVQSYDISSSVLLDSVKLNNSLYFELTNYVYHQKDKYYNGEAGSIQWNYQHLFTTLVFSLNTESTTYNSPTECITHPNSDSSLKITQTYSRLDGFNTNNYGILFEHSKLGGNSYDAYLFKYKDLASTTDFNLTHNNLTSHSVTFDYTDNIRTGTNKRPDEYTIACNIDVYNGKMSIYSIKKFADGRPAGIYNNTLGYLGASLMAEQDIDKLTRSQMNTIPYSMKLLSSVYCLDLNFDDIEVLMIDSDGLPTPFDCRMEFNFGDKEWKIPKLARYFGK